MGEKKDESETAVNLRANPSWIEKLEKYCWENLLSVLWSSLLVIGGLLLFLYYFDLRYFPLLELGSSLAFLAAAGLSGLILLLVSASLVLGPGLMWWLMTSSGPIAEYFYARSDNDIARARNRKFFSLPLLTGTAILFAFVFSSLGPIWTFGFALIFFIVLLPIRMDSKDDCEKNEQDSSKNFFIELSWRVRFKIAYALFFAVCICYIQLFLPSESKNSPAVIFVFWFILATLTSFYIYNDAKKSHNSDRVPAADSQNNQNSVKPFTLILQYLVSIFFSFIMIVIAVFLAMKLVPNDGPDIDQQLTWWFISVFVILLINFFFTEGPPADLSHLTHRQWKGRVARAILFFFFLFSLYFLPTVIVQNLGFGALDNVVLTVDGKWCGRLPSKLTGVASEENVQTGDSICKLPPLCVLSRLRTEYYVGTSKSCPKFNSREHKTLEAFSIPSSAVVSWTKIPKGKNL